MMDCLRLKLVGYTIFLCLSSYHCSDYSILLRSCGCQAVQETLMEEPTWGTPRTTWPAHMESKNKHKHIWGLMGSISTSYHHHHWGTAPPLHLPPDVSPQRPLCICPNNKNNNKYIKKQHPKLTSNNDVQDEDEATSRAVASDSQILRFSFAQNVEPAGQHNKARK